MRKRQLRAGSSNTLIVLAVVTGIFSLLAIGDLFCLFTTCCYSSRDSASLSNLKQIGIGTAMYAVDYDDRYPHEFTTAEQSLEILRPYIKNDQIFSTVKSEDGETMPNLNLQEQFVLGVVDPDLTVLHYESKDWDDEAKRSVVYADTHAKNVSGFDETTDLAATFVYVETPEKFIPEINRTDWYVYNAKGEEVVHLSLEDNRTYSLKSAAGYETGRWKIMSEYLYLYEETTKGEVVSEFRIDNVSQQLIPLLGNTEILQQKFKR